MPASSYYAAATFAIVGLTAAVAWVAGRFSKKWADRIGCFGLIALVQGSILVLMIWAKE